MNTTIKRNLGWLLISQAATWIVSILILLIAPRVLGDHAFGQLSFVIVYVSFFDLLANFGTSSYLTKTLARDTASVGKYVANALVMKVIATTTLLCSAIGLGLVLGFPRDVMLLVSAYCLGTFFAVLYTTMRGALAGLQLMAGPAKWDIVTCYVGGIGSLIILMNHGSLFAFALVFNLSLMIPIPANFLRLWPEVKNHLHIDFGLWKEILRGGLPFFILSALLVVYGTIDIPMLQAFAGTEQVGWYSLAYRWVSVPAFFAASVGTAFFPALSAEGMKITAAFATMANRAVRLAVFVATPAAIGIALIAGPFLTLLYGPEFQNAVPLLRILALHIPIVSLDIILGSVVIAADRQRPWVMVSVAAAIINPLLNLAAIPLTQRLFHNGAIGASIVTVLTELILMVGAIALRPAGVLDKTTINTLVRVAFASMAMVPVVLALGSAPLAVLILAGVVTYAAASLALRTISVQEIKDLVGGYLGRGRRKPTGWPDPNPGDVVLNAAPLTEDPMFIDQLTRFT